MIYFIRHYSDILQENSYNDWYVLVIGGHKVELKVTTSPAPDVAKSSQEMVLFKKPSQAMVPQAKPEPQATLNTGGMSLVLNKPASNSMTPPSASASGGTPSKSANGATKPSGMMAPPSLL